ncbi:MAG: glycosyltransferase family 4 protein [Bdellovibrionaceae bacterium]|nr:glycosyltransferase family 4 protein [Pseudobdellovibrionaceae bacterium]
MDKKKILFLMDDIWSMGPGKGVTSTWRLLQRAEQDFEIVVITTDSEFKAESLPNASVLKVKKPKVTTGLRFLDLVLMRVSVLFVNFQQILIALICVKSRPDVIYCSSSVPVFAAFVLRIFWRTRLIHRIYGTFLFPFLGNSWRLLRKYEEVALFRLFADLYIITDDGTNGDLVAQYFGIPPNKVSYLRNGIEHIDFKGDSRQRRAELFRKYGIPESELVLVTVSRLVRWKRVARVVEAFKRANVKDSCLLVLGDGPDRDELMAQAKGHRIYFLGAVLNDEVKLFLSCSDLFLSFFDYSNVGNTLLEAISYGLPVITLDVGQTKKVIGPTNGILIPAGGESEIVSSAAEAIQDLAADKKKYGKLSFGALAFSKLYLETWDDRISREIEIIAGLAVSKVGVDG